MAEYGYGMHLLIGLVFKWPFTIQVVSSRRFFLIQSYPSITGVESDLILYLRCLTCPQLDRGAEELNQGRITLCSHCH